MLEIKDGSTFEEIKKDLADNFTKEDLIDFIIAYAKDQSFDEKEECAFILGQLFMDRLSDDYCNKASEVLVKTDLADKEILF